MCAIKNSLKQNVNSILYLCNTTSHSIYIYFTNTNLSFWLEYICIPITRWPSWWIQRHCMSPNVSELIVFMCLPVLASTTWTWSLVKWSPITGNQYVTFIVKHSIIARDWSIVSSFVLFSWSFINKHFLKVFAYNVSTSDLSLAITMFPVMSHTEMCSGCSTLTDFSTSPLSV